MCQQTQVKTVIPYFERWIKEFPTIESLANASLDSVNVIWAGLGYYSRAKSLHEAAIKIIAEFNGQLPNTLQELKTLPGVGDYTAGAICSLSYNQPQPAVDGNVLRVFSRLGAVSLPVSNMNFRKAVTQSARDLLAKGANDRYGDINQSLMELGATVCKPTSPACDECPLAKICKVHKDQKLSASQIAAEFPAKKLKVSRPLVYVDCIVASKFSTGEILVTRRPNKGLLKGLWELVCIENEKPAMNGASHAVSVRLSEFGMCTPCVNALRETKSNAGEFKHVFSHLEHKVTVWTANIHSAKPCACKLSSSSCKWIPSSALTTSGLTSAMIKSLKLAGKI